MSPGINGFRNSWIQGFKGCRTSLSPSCDSSALAFFSAVSPFVVPNTTSLVALVKRESLPQLFQHKVTELSPSGANWGHASSPPTWYLTPTETEEGPLACRNLRHLPAHQGAPRRRGSQRRVGVTAALRNLMKEVSSASWGSRHRAGVLLQQPGTGRSKQVLPEKPPYFRLRDRYLG